MSPSSIFTHLKQFLADGAGEENKLDEAAGKLTELAMEIPFTSPQVEKDNDMGACGCVDQASGGLTGRVAP